MSCAQLTLKDRFIEFYFNRLRFYPTYEPLYGTVEGSPSHRERNVAVHTDMVIAQYLLLSSSELPNKYWLRGAFACAFHDFGKPKAERTAYKKERGIYRRYHGHELMSARLWEDWAVQHYHMLTEDFEFVPEDIYAIGWMIQNHLPYRVQNEYKRCALRKTAMHVMGENVFSQCLKADSWGRIADDHPAKKIGVLQWLEEFTRFEHTRFEHQDAGGQRHTKKASPSRTVYLLIGAPGSGKSSFAQNQKGTVHSMDALRLAWYSPCSGDLKRDYHEAFEAACKDASFERKTQEHFENLLESEASDIYVDNINVNEKNRSRYITEARKWGCRVVGVIFPITRNTLLKRQASRHDKDIHADAVENHWWNVQYPSLGEVDEVMVRLSDC